SSPHPRTRPLQLLPHRLHRPSSAFPADAPEQAAAVRPAVPLRGGYVVGGGGEPQAARRRGRLSLDPDHLESNAHPSSASALRPLVRGLRLVRRRLGAADIDGFLRAQGSSRDRLSRQVLRRLEVIVSPQATRLSRLLGLAGRTARLRAVPPPAASPHM